MNEKLTVVSEISLVHYRWMQYSFLNAVFECVCFRVFMSASYCITLQYF